MSRLLSWGLAFWLMALVTNGSAGSQARADPLSDALYAYDHGAGPKAIDLLTPLANAGEVKAAEALLHIYAYGEGVAQDKTLTLKWSRRAAELGSAIGENSIGAAYYNGEGGLEKDAEQALVWWRRAASHGSPKAEYVLGQAYLNGSLVPRSPMAAFRLVQQAADAGYEKAELLMARMYFHGDWAHPPNIQLSINYMMRAAMQGNTGAEIAVGLVEFLDRFPPGHTPNPSAAVKWLILANRGGCVVAMKYLRPIAQLIDPTDLALGVQLADQLEASRSPRDPHVHAEDPTDGCSPSIDYPPPSFQRI